MTSYRFRDCLDLIGWTGSQLAARLRKDPRMIQRWKSGKMAVPDDVAAKLEKLVALLATFHE